MKKAFKIIGVLIVVIVVVGGAGVVIFFKGNISGAASAIINGKLPPQVIYSANPPVADKNVVLPSGLEVKSGKQVFGYVVSVSKDNLVVNSDGKTIELKLKEGRPLTILKDSGGIVKGNDLKILINSFVQINTGPDPDLIDKAQMEADKKFGKGVNGPVDPRTYQAEADKSIAEVYNNSTEYYIDFIMLMDNVIKNS